MMYGANCLPCSGGVFFGRWMDDGGKKPAGGFVSGNGVSRLLLGKKRN